MSESERQSSHTMLLQRYEEAIGAIYKEYARIFPHHKNHWQRLSGDEIRHADWVQVLGKRIKDGSVRLSEQHMVPSQQVMRLLDEAAAELARAGSGNITSVEALSAALRLERGMIEGQWFRFFESDHEELKRVFGSLADETEKHIAAIEKLYAEVTGSKSA